MRPRRSSLIAASILLAAPAGLAGQRGHLEAGGAAFLLVPVGARAAALGQAAVADGGSSEAAFWNPAGLADLRGGELALYHASTFASRNTALTAALASRRFGVAALSAYLVDYGTQDVAGRGGTITGRIAPKNVELLGSYATQLVGTLTLGVNYKLIQFRQDCSGDCGQFRDIVGTTHAADVGVQYAAGGDALRFGLVVRHAGFKLQLENRAQADPLPTRVQFGAAYRLFLPGAPGTDRLDARILIDLRNAWGEYANPDASLGLELGYGEVVRLRTGYAFLHSESRGPSIGVGLRFENVTIDFARIFFDSGSLDEPVHLSLRAAL